MEQGGQTMEVRVSNLETRVGNLEKDHTKLVEQDNRIWSTIQAMQAQIQKQSEEQTTKIVEVKTNVETLSKSVNDMRSENAQSIGAMTAVINQSKDTQTQMFDLIKHKQEVASGVEREFIKEKGQNRRSFWENFFRWAGIFASGAVGTLLAGGLLKALGL